MKKCAPLILLLCLFAPNYSRAAFDVFPQGARAAAMGGIGVMNVDAFAAYNNQAALGFLTAPTAAAHYQNRYFETLNMSSGVYATPVPVAGVVALSVASFGHTSLYRENRVGAAVGKRLAERIAIGAQLCYNHVSVQGYGGTSAITAELGILAEPIENLWLGAHIYNFTHSKFFSQSYNGQLPVFLNLGMGYHLTPAASLFAAAEVNSKHNTQLKFGGELKVAQVLALRLGMSAKPMEVYAGFGYSFHNFVVDVAFSRHESLRYSPQISLTYNFEGKEKCRFCP